jgi:hypothetical protein
MMPVDLLQDGAVTLVAVAAVVLILRRYFHSTVNDASPKCSNCASACDDPAGANAASPDSPVSHPLIVVRRSPR